MLRTAGGARGVATPAPSAELSQARSPARRDHFGTSRCSADGTMVGEGWFGSGALMIGAMGRTVLLPSAFAVTPVLAATHLLPANVSSHISPEPQRPSQGARSHRPVLGLHVVPAVQIAMHPPAARFAAAAPSAAAVVTAAPMAVFGLPVLHASGSAANSAHQERARDIG